MSFHSFARGLFFSLLKNLLSFIELFISLDALIHLQESFHQFTGIFDLTTEEGK